MRFRLKNIFTLNKTEEYQEWFNEQTEKSKAQIYERLSKIEREGYFGDHKFLENEIWELK